VPYTGGFVPTFSQRHQRATDDALRAGAQELINGLKDSKPFGLRGGYTSGAWVTGNVLNSIFATEPYTQAGTRHISVYTDVDYARLWEDGHNNRFTRRFEQQQRWAPTLRRKDEDILLVYARVYKRMMGG
jgi:hypothetical protein